MQADRTYWSAWVRILHRWGIGEPFATLLETTGPLKILFAQLVYLGQPLLSGGSQKWQAFASLLENEAESRSFAAFIRQEEAQ
ncbi:MAG TPA: hypothetical protein VN452_03665 [Longilinea sp.]|nr:hypothetical protein [Longilinea sp.]